MAQDGVNMGRRRFLLATTGALGAVGAVGVAIPFVRSWNPSEKARAVGAPTVVDVSKVRVGQLITEMWRGKPIYITRRSAEMMATLESDEARRRLRDPDSRVQDQQPDWAVNDYRSRDESELLILEGVCTHLGCAPTFAPDVRPQPYDPNWQGGFYCPCHGSRFDLAGRVYSDVPAPTNLVVPPYFIEDGIATIGLEEAA